MASAVEYANRDLHFHIMSPLEDNQKINFEQLKTIIKQSPYKTCNPQVTSYRFNNLSSLSKLGHHFKVKSQEQPKQCHIAVLLFQHNQTANDEVDKLISEVNEIADCTLLAAESLDKNPGALSFIGIKVFPISMKLQGDQQSISMNTRYRHTYCLEGDGACDVLTVATLVGYIFQALPAANSIEIDHFFRSVSQVHSRDNKMTFSFDPSKVLERVQKVRDQWLRRLVEKKIDSKTSCHAQSILLNIIFVELNLKREKRKDPPSSEENQIQRQRYSTV